MKKLFSEIKVASNEYVSKYAVNRNVQKLLANDQYIYRLYNKYRMSGPGVFIKGLKYPLGYKVWFRDKDGVLGVYTNQIDNNLKAPTDEDSNWVNTSINGGVDLRGVYAGIAEDEMKKHLETYHSEENVMVRRDLSNTSFDVYPYETRRIRSADRSMQGYVRKWKNGVIEYFLTFVMNSESVEMTKSEQKKFFGGILNSYGSDLDVYSNPDQPEYLAEYFETDVVRSVDIKFPDKYGFSANDYCVFCSNAVDASSVYGQPVQPGRKGCSPIDVVQIYNKRPNGFSVMRRFSSGIYEGDVIDSKLSPQAEKRCLQKLNPANKAYTLYVVGS